VSRTVVVTAIPPHDKGDDVHIQIVNFHLNEFSDADFRAASDELAPAFAELPGLISKVWLANPDANTYGGVYTWESREAMDEYSKSELFASVAGNPRFAGVTSTDFAVLEGPTRVTRGLAEVAAEA
jgi:heme-degrading monooxygenase HmoA